MTKRDSRFCRMSKMPRRLALSLPLILATAAAPLGALAQGLLLPPGEVPGASGNVSSGGMLFSPQPMLPQAQPRAAQPMPNYNPQAPEPIAPAAEAHGAPAAAAPAPAAAPVQAAVPLPTQRPASADQPRPAAPAAQQVAAPRVPPPPAAAQPEPVASNGQAAAATMATVDRLSTYWNSVQTLVGTFVQIDADGSRKTGDFYMQKPGRVRFEYNAPATIELISNGQSVAVRDRRLNTQDITPLGQTPLRFLLADRIDLANNPNVTGIYQDNTYVSVVMQEQVPMLGTYRLLILFDAKDFQLRQWIVTDPQGYDTSVAVSKLNYTQRPDPRLFHINFERMLQ
ncbi:LolA family protein [Xanthobacteraceae bacterium A53D]